MRKTLLVITGPTAVGKTTLAIDLALHYQTEIISTDARQFYKEMNIGTAKPSVAELGSIKHHFINNQSITHLYSAGAFEKEAMLCIEKLFEHHDIVIAVGGSGLYIKALCEGLDDMPEVNLNLRNELVALFEHEGIEALHNRLQQTDPDKLKIIDTKNPQRMMRAIEMAEQKHVTGVPKIPRQFNIIKIGLNTKREILYERINGRVNAMMEAGLLDEARALYSHKHLNALQTVGYTELFRYLDGELALPKAIDLIKQHTRNYAKRQLTWFNKEQDITWFDSPQTTQITQWLHDVTSTS